MTRMRIVVGALALLMTSGPLAWAAVPSVTSRHVGVTYGGYDWSGGTNGYYVYNGTGGGAGYVFQGTANGGQIGFPGLQATRERIVHVTSYGTTASCRVNGWGRSPGELVINVWCGSSLTSALNDNFDVLITRPSPRTHGVFDFAEVDSGRPPLFYGRPYNSSGMRTVVRRLGVGRYQLTFRGPARQGTSGIVQLTAWVFRDCVLAGWHGGRTGEVINVDCYTLSGRPTDRSAVFEATYVTRSNLLGINGMTTANAFANRPHATVSYEPVDQYDSTPGARITVTRLSVGYYKVSLAGSGGPHQTNGGDVQISAVSNLDRRCASYGWSQSLNPVAFVRCANIHGKAADSPFTIAWVVA